jgi:hypothetical protein
MREISSLTQEIPAPTYKPMVTVAAFSCNAAAFRAKRADARCNAGAWFCNPGIPTFSGHKKSRIAAALRG